MFARSMTSTVSEHLGELSQGPFAHGGRIGENRQLKRERRRSRSRRFSTESCCTAAGGAEDDRRDRDGPGAARDEGPCLAPISRRKQPATPNRAIARRAGTPPFGPSCVGRGLTSRRWGLGSSRRLGARRRGPFDRRTWPSRKEHDADRPTTRGWRIMASRRHRLPRSCMRARATGASPPHR